MNNIDLNRNIELMIPENGLQFKLNAAEKAGRRLNIKLGFDPTAPDLHLGHAVILNKLREFQILGHNIIIIIGTFTAKIGDPTGKNASRPPLSDDQVKANYETYFTQLGKILDLEKTIIRFNSEWLDRMGLNKMIELLSSVTVAQLLQRNDFNKRYKENLPISMHELLYPILQGYDSYEIRADIELGGTDQMFNCMMGRHIQESKNFDPQVVIGMPILVGLDGRDKMSKSLNNYISLNDNPNDMFGKVMSIPDSLIENYLKLTTNFSAGEIDVLLTNISNGENPINIKKILAKNIVEQYHNKEMADSAYDFFTNQFQNKNNEEKEYLSFPIISFVDNKLRLKDFCHIIKNDITKSQIKKLIEEGAVQINGVKNNDPLDMINIETGLKVKIGKRNFFEIK